MADVFKVHDTVKIPVKLPWPCKIAVNKPFLAYIMNRAEFCLPHLADMKLSKKVFLKNQINSSQGFPLVRYRGICIGRIPLAAQV